jgi:exportin-1
LLTIPPPQFKLFMDAIIWGIKHTTRDIADASLSCKFGDDQVGFAN